MERVVIKKNGLRTPFLFEKIKTAVSKSANRCGYQLSEDEYQQIELEVDRVLGDKSTANVADIHHAVESALEVVSPDVAKEYKNYRNYKTSFAKSWDDIYKQSRDVMYLGDRENANFDSSLNSTKGSLIRSFLTKELYKKFELRQDELQAITDGYIYIHDLNNLLFRQINCCLFDVGQLLSGGFTMSAIEYMEPKCVLSALQVIGDIALNATAQQFGGWTVPEIDKILIKYVRKSIVKHTKDLIATSRILGTKIVDPEKLHKLVMEKVEEELIQGFQSIEMKLNTVPCSRGDFAFTTLSFGNVKDSEDPELQRMIARAILTVRMNGQGKHGRPVVFPKLVYLYSKEQHKEKEQQELFDHAILCTSKAMYPDYLSIDSQYGDVSRIFNTHGVVTSPMGCRSYLSEYIDPETNKAIAVGRANIGAVSLNLPMIWMKAKEEGREFLDVLHVYLEMIRNFLKRRYDYLSKAPASSNPLAFTQGGLYKGYLKPDEPIGDLVKSFTASFGITALNELNALMTGKQLHETGIDAVEPIVDYINDFIKLAKAKDGYLYALYGTPAESLCGTQLNQFKAKYGVIQGVSDRAYFTNSFHMHVSADIDHFTKQDLEFKLFHKVPGGHIVYNRVIGRHNLQGIKQTCLRGMDLGLYQGFNYELAMCDDCGADDENDFAVCPKCGSRHVTTIGRLCGYLGMVRTNGSSRFNDAKLMEFRDRISM